jgi:hypothetical protein
MLENITFQQLEDDEVEIFQHSGALQHYSIRVLVALSDRFCFLGFDWGEKAQSLGFQCH